MAVFLAAQGQLQSNDKMWLVLSVLGVAFAIAILLWVALKVRSLFQEDEGPAGDVGDFLGQLRESQSEGVLSPEEFRSIQRRLLEQSMGTGDSTRQSRATSAKSAGHQEPPPHPNHDDAGDHSP